MLFDHRVGRERITKLRRCKERVVFIDIFFLSECFIEEILNGSLVEDGERAREVLTVFFFFPLKESGRGFVVGLSPKASSF